MFLCTISIAQDNFVDHLDRQKITDIFSDNRKQLYFSSSDTTYLFDGINFLHSEIKPKQDSLLTKELESLLVEKDEFDLRGTITTAAELSEERLIFTNRTSRLYQKYQGKILRYLIPNLNEELLIINKLIVNGDYLLICTLNDGLYIWKHKEFVLDKINESNGFETNNVNDALLDDWGNLWIATDFGLKQMRYQNKSESNFPHVSIDKINVMYDEVEEQDLVNLEETENSLQFHFSARDYSGGGKLSYQWRINGEQEWQTTNANVVSISSLEPGDYSFELGATNGNGLYGFHDPIPFAIKSTSLGAIWKYVFGGVGALFLLWLWSLMRYNRSLKSSEDEKRKLRLENDLLKTEQKALQLQMNPHFVFNALNSIQGLIALNENQSARKYLNKFSTMMRSMLEQSRGEAISIDDEIKYLDDYLSLERMGREHKFDFNITKSNLIEDIKIPSMLVQPFVENAIVHGMKGLERKGMIKLNFKMDGEHLVCEIDDNGVGRDKSKHSSTHKSLGMQVVEDRLQKYSKFKNYKNLTLTDKKNPDGSNAGTSVLIKLPQL